VVLELSDLPNSLYALPLSSPPPPLLSATPRVSALSAPSSGIYLRPRISVVRHKTAWTTLTDVALLTTRRLSFALPLLPTQRWIPLLSSELSFTDLLESYGSLCRPLICLLHLSQSYCQSTPHVELFFRNNPSRPCTLPFLLSTRLRVLRLFVSP